MMRNLRATTVKGEAVEWPVVVRSGRGPFRRSEKAKGEVISSGSALGKVDL
jgi:hypothetical protein